MSKPEHISTAASYPNGANAEPVYEKDGLCHCKVARSVSPVGECSRCRRLVVLR